MNRRVLKFHIIIETFGVGQSEVDITVLAFDNTPPPAGDYIGTVGKLFLFVKNEVHEYENLMRRLSSSFAIIIVITRSSSTLTKNWITFFLKENYFTSCMVTSLL